MKSSSYQLVMSAMFNGRKGDRPPTGTPTSIACHDLMDVTGVSFPQAHLNANAMAELALGGYETIGFDTEGIFGCLTVLGFNMDIQYSSRLF